MLIAQRSHEDTKAFKPLGQPKNLPSQNFTHNKSKSSWIISNSLLLAGFHLKGR